MPKLLLTVFIGLFATTISFAQDTWTSIYGDNMLSLEYRYFDCHQPADGLHKQEIYLKFTNLTQSTITVTYQKQLEYNNKPAGQPGQENTFTVTLKPGEVLEGSCGLRDKRLYLFVKMLDGTSQSVLTAFDLVNIKVTRS